MKKTLLIAAMACTVAFSCNKQDRKTTSGPETSTSQQLTTTASLSVGQKHNAVLGAYIDVNGHFDPSTVPTEEKVKSILVGMIQIAKDKNFVSSDLSASVLADQEVQRMKDDGYFDAGVFKPSTERIDIAIGKFETPALRGALTDIKNYNGPEAEFLNFAHAKIGSVASMTEDEAAAMGSFFDVLDNSSNFWDGQVITGINKSAAYADAIGYAGAMLQGIRLMLPWPLLVEYAIFRSLVWSYEQV